MMKTGDKAANTQMEGRIAIKLIQENGGERNEKRTGAKRSSRKVFKSVCRGVQRERETWKEEEVAEVRSRTRMKRRNSREMSVVVEGFGGVGGLGLRVVGG